MSTLVTIAASDLISNSRTDINSNFSALNSEKIETSVLDTDTALTANSDLKVATQKAVKAYIDALGGLTYLVPTGAILPYGAATAPSNYLLCDGSAVSRSTYATLFGIIGTNYGVGDGSSTFNVPNMCGRVPLGKGTGTKVATFASRSSDTITVTGLTNAANNEFQTGQAVLYHTTGTDITGLTNDTTYYVIYVTATSFKLASSLANAIAGTQISLSGDGTGTRTFTLTLTARTVGDTGGEENHALTTAELAAHTHSGTTGDAASAPSPTKFMGNTSTNNPGSVATSSTGGSTAHSEMNPFVVVNYIIKI